MLAWPVFSSEVPAWSARATRTGPFSWKTWAWLGRTRCGYAAPRPSGSCCQRAVAIVGSRAATAYGAHVATEIAASLSGQGWTVVSGAAYGIDAAAHHGALVAGGATVAVLACGVDHAYPRGHADLLASIAAHGAVISEYPPGQLPQRRRFLARNRLIAALTAGTVVVEAGLRSGALNAARHARELGRPVMAVPGPVTSSASGGCHQLIRDGQATCVTCAADVITDVSPATGAAFRLTDRSG